MKLTVANVPDYRIIVDQLLSPTLNDVIERPKLRLLCPADAHSFSFVEAMRCKFRRSMLVFMLVYDWWTLDDVRDTEG